VTPERFQAITGRYAELRIAVIGDFCLDRYLEIDPARQEVSIETSLPVYNVVNVRAQPGGAGTILNNLAALGIGDLFPVGFSGDDGEGYELRRALRARPGVRLDHFLQTSERRTFTYCKPLVMEPGKSPRELNRLDQKNWTPTPGALAEGLSAATKTLATQVDAIVLLSQVDQPETGVLNQQLLECIRDVAGDNPERLIFADSRHGLSGYPPVIFKMNGAELETLTGLRRSAGLQEISNAAGHLARRNGKPVFVTLAERGMLGALPDRVAEHVPALPLRGEIDIVGAGDAVLANLTAALAAKATLLEALHLASCAASVVIHQLGTTGTAAVGDLRNLALKSPESLTSGSAS
jgi:rfaE bifunctional protein kinase chain/domain